MSATYRRNGRKTDEKLPEADAERPHGLKYLLYYGTGDECLVRYDNERGKGDHRHYGEREEPSELERVDLIGRDEEGRLIAPWDVINAQFQLVA